VRHGLARRAAHLVVDDAAALVSVRDALDADAARL
jgi:hypothetical protein